MTKGEMNMEVFIRKPSVDLFCGIKVDKDTKLEYKAGNVEQRVENLVLHSVTKTSGEDYESVWRSAIQLKEGDVLIFEEEGRGYIKPLEQVCTIAEAIRELANIKDIGDRVV